MSCFDYTPDRWDRERDERKHDPRPGDIPTAVEVASLVKQLPNVMDGAALIEAYGRDCISRQKLAEVANART